MIRGASPVWSIAASVLFVAAVLGVLIYFDTHRQVLLCWSGWTHRAPGRRCCSFWS